MAEPPSRDLNKFVVRLPEGMRERIALAARRNNRSMNSQVVAYIEEGLDFDERPLTPERKAELLHFMKLLEAARQYRRDEEPAEAESENSSPDSGGGQDKSQG